MKLRAIALALAASMIATVPGLASAAGRGGHHHGPRVSIGVGVGFGGFYDPFYDPFWDYGYPGYPAYGYVPQPAAPCTPADVPTKEPSNSPFTPDYAYDRIDAARCAPQAAASVPSAPMQAVPPAQVGPSGQPQQPGAYYFCRSANAYYPQVGQCAEGWQQVAPKPPGT